MVVPTPSSRMSFVSMAVVVYTQERINSCRKTHPAPSTQSTTWQPLYYHGGQAFLETISQATPGTDDTQLDSDEQKAERRLSKALTQARRVRSNPEPYLLSATRNWSRKQAIAILRDKIAGKAVRPDFYQAFQSDLQQEVATMLDDVQQAWQQEDEHATDRMRAEAERAFGDAYPFIQGLGDAILQGEQERRTVFESGQNMAQAWADRYKESVNERENHVQVREDRIGEQEHENREQQLALRSLSRWDDHASFGNTEVSTGRNALGCLLLWLLLMAGALLAVYLAFPHH